MHIGLREEGRRVRRVAGRTDGIEWYGWVLALIGALVCMTGCELYKCYVKHFAPPPI